MKSVLYNLLPGRGMLQSMKHLQNGKTLHKRNLVVIRHFWRITKTALRKNYVPLQALVCMHGKEMVSEYFLFKKRIILAVLALLAAVLIYSVLHGAHVITIITQLIWLSVVYCWTLFAQQRLWQIEEGNYNAPIADLIQSRRFWFLSILNIKR